MLASEVNEPEEVGVRRAAEELGIPTAGRPLTDIKKDLKEKMA
jgi:hypothetical protein